MRRNNRLISFWKTIDESVFFNYNIQSDIEYTTEDISMELKFLTIEKIEIDQFKKIRNLSISPDQNGNLLFGTYRSGKTSLCEFIQFALYGAESVSLARGNTEDAKGKLFLNSDKGSFVIERSVIEGIESVLFYTENPENPVITDLTPGEYLTELDRDSFDLINYFRQTKYESPVVKPKFSMLNKIASFSPETECIYKDLFVLDKKRRLYQNDDKNGSLDLLFSEQSRLENELKEHPDWEAETRACTSVLGEIQEKIDENDRRCVLLKADMAGYEDDLRLTQNKENAEELFHKIAAKEKKLRIMAYEVSSKIGKLPKNELEELKQNYNRLSISIADLNEARLALSSAQENLNYHEALFTGKNSLEELDEKLEQIEKEKKRRFTLSIFGILFMAGAAGLALLLNYLNFDETVCIASAAALALCGFSCLFISTLFSSRVKNIIAEYNAETLNDFYDFYEKVAAHSKTSQVYLAEVESAKNLCSEKAFQQKAITNQIAAKVKSLGFKETDGDLLAICDQIIDANETVYDLQEEVENEKALYLKMLTENVESDSLTVSPEFSALQKEFAFLSAQNDALYKKKAAVSARLQKAKEKSAKMPEEIQKELDSVKEKLIREKADFDKIDLNYTLAKARKDKFESELKKVLALKINRRMAFLLREGESFRFDEDFELCFCDQKSILPVIAAGGGVITEMGVLSLRLTLAELLGSTKSPMIFDDSLAILTTEQAKEFYKDLRNTCSQFFVITSSEEFCEACRDEANLVVL